MSIKDLLLINASIWGLEQVVSVPIGAIIVRGVARGYPRQSSAGQHVSATLGGTSASVRLKEGG
eukprot:6492003-Amphidinium_carterae.2